MLHLPFSPEDIEIYYVKLCELLALNDCKYPEYQSRLFREADIVI